jgi:hypothetical protein
MWKRAVIVGGAAGDVSRLSARVDSLEQRVDRISRTTKPDDQRRVALGERQAEFLKHVWAD